MKAFISAILALVVISAGADYALDYVGFSAAERYSGPAVRVE